jgi:hypothetical protein
MAQVLSDSSLGLQQMTGAAALLMDTGLLMALGAAAEATLPHLFDART